MHAYFDIIQGRSGIIQCKNIVIEKVSFIKPERRRHNYNGREWWHGNGERREVCFLSKQLVLRNEFSQRRKRRWRFQGEDEKWRTKELGVCDAEPLRFGAPPLCRRTLILRAASQWPKKPYGKRERERCLTSGTEVYQCVLRRKH